MRPLPRELSEALGMAFGIPHDERAVDEALGLYRLVPTVLAFAAALLTYTGAMVRRAFDPAPGGVSPLVQGVSVYLVLVMVPPFVHEVLVRVRAGKIAIGLRPLLQLFFTAAVFGLTLLRTHGDFVETLVNLLQEEFPIVAAIPTLVNFADVPLRWWARATAAR